MQALRAHGSRPVPLRAASAASTVRCSISSSRWPCRSTIPFGRAPLPHRAVTHRAWSAPGPCAYARHPPLPPPSALLTSAIAFLDFCWRQLSLHHLHGLAIFADARVALVNEIGGYRIRDHGNAVVTRTCTTRTASPAASLPRTRRRSRRDNRMVGSAFTRRSSPADRREFAPENRHTPLDCQGTRSHP